jgi:hypothetical protein
MRFAKSLAHMVNGTATFLLSLPSGKTAIVRSLRRICLGAGMLAALLGHRFLPYQGSGSVGNAAKVATRSSHDR